MICLDWMKCKIGDSTKLVLLSFTENGTICMWDMADQFKFPKKLWKITSFDNISFSIKEIISSEPNKGEFYFITNCGKLGHFILQRKFEFKNCLELETSNINLKIKSFLKCLNPDILLKLLFLKSNELSQFENFEFIESDFEIKSSLYENLNCSILFNLDNKNFLNLNNLSNDKIIFCNEDFMYEMDKSTNFISKFKNNINLSIIKLEKLRLNSKNYNFILDSKY